MSERDVLAILLRLEVKVREHMKPWQGSTSCGSGDNCTICAVLRTLRELDAARAQLAAS